MGRQREDIRDAMQLLLTPKQYAYVMATRGRSRQQWLRMLVQDGIRYRMGDVVMQERYAEAAFEYLDRLRAESPGMADELEGLVNEPC